MKRTILPIAFLTVTLTALPFYGGGGPGLSPIAETPDNDYPIAATYVSPNDKSLVEVFLANYEPSDEEPNLTVDTEHLAQKPVPKPITIQNSTGPGGVQARKEYYGGSCPGDLGGGGSAPGRVSAGGVSGTTTDDIQSFAAQYNAIRVANCLPPIPAGNFRYDSCMEDRLFWMAEDPSEDPASAWGHAGSVRSDGVPSYGCDGNLAGGSGNSGATVAQKWWNSTAHRNSLYRPTYVNSTAGVCIYFAMTHGGVPNEPYSFTRAAARWGSC